MKRGNYYGTEIEGKWWRRYRGAGFFARGNGELWMDEGGLHFRRLLTRDPLSVPWDEMTNARLGKWHCGRSSLGRPLLKIDFRRDGLNLTAGFHLEGDRAEMEPLITDLTERMSRR